MTSWPASEAGPDQPTRPRVRITQLSAMDRARCTNCSLSTMVIPDLRASSRLSNTDSVIERGEPERQLVGDDQLGRDGERPGEGQHLLLATGQAPGPLGGPRAQHREPLDGPLDGRRPLGARLLGHRHAQVVGDREAGEDATPLGDVGEAQPADRDGRVAR